MGRLNYGPYIFDKKGILSSVYVDGRHLFKWRMLSIPFHNLNEGRKISSIVPDAYSNFIKVSSREDLNDRRRRDNMEPTFYTGRFAIDQVKDTYLSFNGWSKGIAFVNEFNIGRYWPSVGPQCNLYVPAPILRGGENVVVILELESASSELCLSSTDQPDFTCGSIG